MSRTDCLKEAFAMKKLFSGIVAASVVLTLAVSAYADANLTDVTPGSWFYNEVSEMGAPAMRAAMVTNSAIVTVRSGLNVPSS